MMCVGERLGRSVALIVVIGAKLEWLHAAINWTLIEFEHTGEGKNSLK